jgi:hypothetical protein
MASASKEEMEEVIQANACGSSFFLLGVLAALRREGAVVGCEHLQ